MKNKIREEMKAKRKMMSQKEVMQKSSLAEKLFLESQHYKNAKNLMLYIPLGNEVSTLEIISDALRQGKNVVVPVTDRKTYEISAYRISESTEFEKGMFSVFEPKEKTPFPADEIDVVLVPGIAFDRSGGRIGFGKGCYDKFLKDVGAIKIGFCYDFQLADRVETNSNDIAMDYIITEKEFIRGKL